MLALIDGVYAGEKIDGKMTLEQATDKKKFSLSYYNAQEDVHEAEKVGICRLTEERAT